MHTHGNGTLDVKGTNAGECDGEKFLRVQKFFKKYSFCISGKHYMFEKLFWNERGSEGYVAKYTSTDHSVVLKVCCRANGQCADATAIAGVVPCISILMGRVQIMPCARTDGFRLYTLFSRLESQNEYSKSIRYFSQIGAFLLTTCSTLIKQGVVPCDIKAENILVRSLQNNTLVLWLGDIDGMVTAATRRTTVTVTHAMSHVSVFDPTLDTATCLFAICLTMLDYTNSMCPEDENRLELSADVWMNDRASYPFSMDHPFVRRLTTLPPSNAYVDMLRAPFVTTLLQLALCGEKLHDGHFVLGLVDTLAIAFDAHISDCMLAETLKTKH
jgi:hypothetical protein